MSIKKEWDEAVDNNTVWLFLIKHGATAKSQITNEDMPQSTLQDTKFQQYAEIYQAYIKAKSTDDASDFLAHGGGNKKYSLVNNIELENELQEQLKYYSNQLELKAVSMFRLVTDRKLRKSIPEEQIIDEIKKRISQNNTNALIAGPLNISTDTQNLMRVAADFLNDQISEVKIENNKYILYYENGNTFDLSACISNANLSHISFDEKDLHQKFVDFAYRQGSTDSTYKDFNKIHPYMRRGGGTSVVPEFFRTLDPDGTKLSHLSDAEIAGINIYTNEYFDAMNDFLEGKIKVSIGSVIRLKEVILSSVFCAAGLNKTPIKTYHTSYRGSSSQGDALEKKKQLAKDGAIVYEKGFTSTSSGAAMKDWVDSSALIFMDGVLGQDVSLISAQPGEREVLIIPTQIQYLGSYEEEGKTYFLVRSIRTLSGLTPEFQLQRNKQESVQEENKSLNQGLAPDKTLPQKSETKTEPDKKSSQLVFSKLNNSTPKPDDKVENESGLKKDTKNARK